MLIVIVPPPKKILLECEINEQVYGAKTKLLWVNNEIVASTVFLFNFVCLDICVLNLEAVTNVRTHLRQNVLSASTLVKLPKDIKGFCTGQN